MIELVKVLNLKMEAGNDHISRTKKLQNLPMLHAI